MFSISVMAMEAPPPYFPAAFSTSRITRNKLPPKIFKISSFL